MSSIASVVVPGSQPSQAHQRGFWCGIGAFVTWFGMGVESVLRPFQDNRRETFWVLPFAFTVATFYYLHKVQRERSRTELAGYGIVLVASAMVLLGNIGLQLNVHTFDWFGFPGGPIVWLVGLACFGIGTMFAGVVPKYAGWALIFLEPLSIAVAVALSPVAPLLQRGAYSGNVGKGTAMLIVAIGIYQSGKRNAEGVASRRAA